MLRNKNQRELLVLSKNIIQPLLPHFHKGQAGKITVIGGSEDYTGAPYFSAHSAALVGADMARVVCEVTAAPTIKLYSADLMVHPYLYNLNSSELSISKDDVAKYSKLPVEELVAQRHPVLDDIIDSIILPKITPVLDRSDLVIVGPGFGRDPLMLKSLVRIIEEIKVLNKPIIVDADGLYLLSVKPSLIQNYSKAILSPNPVEFDRLAKKQGVQSSLTERSVDRLAQQTTELSNSLGKVTIIRKGEKDIIAKGDEYLINEVNGSNKRVGGQGDTLTGAIATIVNWSNNYSDKLWDSDESQRLDRDEANLLAVFAASSLVKLASHKAYRKHGRSMQASNVHEFLGESYSDLFEGDSFLKL